MTTRLLISALVLLGVATALLGRPDLRRTLPGAALEATRIETAKSAGGPGTLKNASFPKHLIDPSGETNLLEAAPERIASATLASDEILLQLVGSPALIGVTRLIDDPNLSLDAGAVPADVARIEASAERVIPLSPDLVVVANFTRAETAHLVGAAGLPLLRLGAFTSFADVFSNIKRLASATGTEAKAKTWVDALRVRVRRVERNAAGKRRPRVLYLAGATYTAGRGSLVDEILTRAGANNCAREVGLRGSAPISTELAIALQPEIVLITGWSASHGDATALSLRNDPRWREVPAVRNDLVHVMHSALMLSVTHHVVDALEAVHQVIHASSPQSSSEAGRGPG